MIDASRNPLDALPPKADSAALRSLQLAGLLLAGMLAFGVAQLARQWMDADTAAEGNVVLPADRVGARRNAINASPGKPAGIPGPSSDTAPDGGATPTSRMDAEVVRDPFGPLNLLAGNKAQQQADTAQTAARPSTPARPKTNLAQAPAPEPTVTPPPPAPVAPPLPFQSVGSIQSPALANGSAAAFLKQGDDLLVVRAGDKINQLYRVDAITATQVVLTYLPLNQRQTLALTP